MFDEFDLSLDARPEKDQKKLPYYRLDWIRFGAIALHKWKHNPIDLYANDISLIGFKRWKEDPVNHPEITKVIADDLIKAIRLYFPVIPNCVIACPPQGVSYHKGKIYPIGCVGKEMAKQLDRDFITIFEPWYNKKHHGKWYTKDLPLWATVKINPHKLVILIDDFINMGNTIMKALAGLDKNKIPAVVFIWSRT